MRAGKFTRAAILGAQMFYAGWVERYWSDILRHMDLSEYKAGALVPCQTFFLNMPLSCTA